MFTVIIIEWLVGLLFPFLVLCWKMD